MDIGEFSEKSNKFCKVGGGGESYLPWTSIPWGGGWRYPGRGAQGGGGV